MSDIGCTYTVECWLRDSKDITEPQVTAACATLNAANIVWNADKGSVLMDVAVSPSKVLTKLENTLRQPVLIRGISNQESAVAILYDDISTMESPTISTVHGLCRLFTLAESKEVVVDVNVNGVAPNVPFDLSIMHTGDISRGTCSTGSPWIRLAELTSSCHGTIQTIFSMNGRLDEWIGRALTLIPKDTKPSTSISLLGIIARSAGVGQGNKTVCSCSGKTLWEEQQENAYSFEARTPVTKPSNNCRRHCCGKC
ncbi:metallochaperone Ccs1 [Schizosaccharomyces japonicus yFS275]|uniref:Metallochaperone Ccs1 n=1 Tax=Schizosaccharomyces japonicus (strain yFS275 / FY16936) TaxID=402676 RepID=B6K6R5_SCHJY|nr:metallochaperone Ccs1 [Schizosaccharomyces japonicus yFS275]EEB09219.1 metallochaperone Ccs1 [Schizosaccharomyces japonicus yFS275]